MAKPSVVNLSINAALSLGLPALGVYVKGKALLARGRKAFCLADIGDDKGLARDALGQLLSEGLVVHRGGGWYALARVPTKSKEASSHLDLGKKMSRAAKRMGLNTQGAYEQLRDALKICAKQVYGHDLPASLYSASNRSNKIRYGRIARAVREADAAAEQFARFVFGLDWSWTREGYPGLGLLCTDDFLNKFKWFAKHGAEVDEAGEILVIYDRAFGFTGSHKYEDHIAILQLQSVLTERKVAFDQFFSYAASRQWKSFDGLPPIKFLTSDDFVNQACAALQAPGQRKRAYGAVTYLERIEDRLKRISLPISDNEFEDRNWDIGEAVFEPLTIFANNSVPQLDALVRRVIDEKDSPKLGFYLITYDGKLTPLAVYWMTFAASRLGDSFCSPGSGPWKDRVRRLASEAVVLDILEV